MSEKEGVYQEEENDCFTVSHENIPICAFMYLLHTWELSSMIQETESRKHDITVHSEVNTESFGNLKEKDVPLL